jgi:hypothetical protein
MYDHWRGPVLYANIIMKLLSDLQNLKTLLIYIDRTNIFNCITQQVFSDTTKCLDMNRIMKNSDQYLLVLKRDTAKIFFQSKKNVE